MDWQNGMERAIDYIESKLSGEEEIDLDAAARLAGCSAWEFQRMFSFLLQNTVGGYIRQRKLSLAAIDLMNGREKIIDIAMKYGYESPAAFSRAFNKLFGITPSSARGEGTKLKLFPRLTFNNVEESRSGTMDKYSKRGYYVTSNTPVYLTNDMDRTCKWFRDILGWYGSTCAYDENGTGVYGCVFDYPGEIFDTITPQRGFYLFDGPSSQELVGFMGVKGLDNLRNLVINNGWDKITEITVQNWGARACFVTTIDGSILEFHEAAEK